VGIFTDRRQAEGPTMTDQQRHPRVRGLTRRRLALGTVVAAITVGSVGAASSLAADGTSSARSDSIQPSEQVMRELRATIVALYGPPAAPAGALRRGIHRTPSC
jgi:hypothetical protein